MSLEVKNAVEKLAAEWASFKSENDRRLKEIEAKGRADPLTEEKINKHSEAIGQLQAQLDEVQKKAQRPGVGGATELDAKKAEHREAWLAWARTGEAGALKRLEAAISTDTDTKGGFLVPSTTDPEIERYERDATPMRQVCRVVGVSNEEFEKLVKTGSANSGWVGEREARPETGTPDYEALVPYFGEVYANPRVTQKALDDIAFNLESELAQDIGVEFGEQENAAFTSGTGVKKPKGILGYTLSTSADAARTFGQIQKIVSGSSGAFVADKLIDVVHSLKAAYRGNASWMMSTLGVAAIRKLKDATSGLYLFQPSFMAGQPATILGYPVNENEAVPDPAADANAALFGDYRRAYYIVDVRGVRMLRDPYTAKPFVQFYTTKRVGGFLVNDQAVKVLTLSA